MSSRARNMCPETESPMAALAGSGFSRVADAAFSDGNAIELLRDGPENFPRWLTAIAEARRTVYLENYILQADATGHDFAEALIAAAERGVKCRVLYDWMGCRTRTPPVFWERLRHAGVSVRCYNPPRLGNPLSLISRDHRKVLCVDGLIAFTGGLCIGDDWVGYPDRAIPAWRDTGIAVRGPAVRDIEAAFADSWKVEGQAISRLELGREEVLEPVGDLKTWVIAGRPDEMSLYRLEQLVAEIAETSLWLTDAYFVGTTGYVHALCGAARAGVDVRLLVPGSSNWPVVGALSRVGYRALLEAGVRVFEWDGPMLHAKTTVADGCWSRVGSSNSNLASWTTNRELDVTIQDAGFGAAMAAMFEQDLQNATEIVLQAGSMKRAGAKPRSNTDRSRKRHARRNRLVAGTVGLGSAVGAAITRHRSLGAAEAGTLVAGGAAITVLALLVLFLPRLLSYPIGVLGLWLGGALLVRAWRTRRGHQAAQSGKP